jgi:hypothetical protein
LQGLFISKYRQERKNWQRFIERQADKVLFALVLRLPYAEWYHLPIGWNLSEIRHIQVGAEFGRLHGGFVA